MIKVCDIDNKVQEILDNTNPICYKTKHKPNLEIPEKLQEFIINVEKVMKTYNYYGT